MHATLAAVRSPLLAGAMIVVFGVHTVVWGVVRHRRSGSGPCRRRMFGRVTSVYALVDLGGAALGSLLGGLVAQAYWMVAMFLKVARAMVVVAVAASAAVVDCHRGVPFWGSAGVAADQR